MATATIHNQSGKVINEYYIDDRLKRNLLKIKESLNKRDKDCVLVIDGREGSGKSTLAIQIGKFVDNSLELPRVVFSPEDFREAILKAKKGQCIIYDEAFTGYSSRSSLSPINRVLVSLAMQMRQKNLLVLIVLPTIFLLDKYMAMFRTKALIHVYENKGVRGYFKLYNTRKKKILILRGQKMMSYHHKGLYTNFNGRFYGKFVLGDENTEKKYREKKEKALRDSEKSSMSSAQVKFREQRDLLIYLLRKNTKLKYRAIENLLADYDLDMSFQQISKICAKFGDVLTESEKNEKKKEEKEDEIEEEVEEIEEIKALSPDEDDIDGEDDENDEILEESDDKE